VTAIALGAALGALLGVGALPLVRRLPRGIPERAPQPAWTRRADDPRWLAVAGAVGGAIALGGPADDAGRALALLLVAVLVPAVAIDLMWRVVPDTLVVAGALGAVGVLASAGSAHLVEHAAWGLAVGAVLLLAALAARGGLGGGDVKLGALLGLALGPAVVVAIAAAGLVGGVLAVGVLLRRGRGATLPLVPVLALGALIVLASAGLPMPGGGAIVS
jgi:Flp pilus assembly protein protease CpaA